MGLVSDMSVQVAVLDSHVDNVVGDFSGLFGEFNLAGHGVVTNSSCGKFKSFLVCARTDLHKLVTLDGKNYSGKVYVKKLFNSCDKPSCPICYKYGWAVRESFKVSARLGAASKRFGLVEHFSVSLAKKDYGLSFKATRRKAIDACLARGIVGGVIFFHRDRFNDWKRWYVSPHFHVLGFLLGGYGRCRSCRQQYCSTCDGFEGRTRKLNLTDGFVVKVCTDDSGVAGERETVGGTAWYMLNHSSYEVGVKRSNVAVWFGCCSYRKLKVTVEMKKHVCPICQHDMEKMRYLGSKPDILASYDAVLGKGSGVGSYADAVEDGLDVWVAVVGERVYG